MELWIRNYKCRLKSIFSSGCFMGSWRLALKLPGHTKYAASSTAKGILFLTWPSWNLATTTAALSPCAVKIVEWGLALIGWMKEAVGGKRIISCWKLRDRSLWNTVLLVTNGSETRAGTDLLLMSAPAVRCCQDSLRVASIPTLSVMRYTWPNDCVLVAPASLGQYKGLSLTLTVARLACYSPRQNACYATSLMRSSFLSAARAVTLAAEQ